MSSLPIIFYAHGLKLIESYKVRLNLDILCEVWRSERSGRLLKVQDYKIAAMVCQPIDFNYFSL